MANVIDYYKYWKTDAIVADLDSKRFNFSIVCCNIHGDFNIGTIIRSANAFLAKEVIMYGKKKYDKRGTVGTHNYTHFKHVRETDDLSFLSASPTIGVDNVDRAKQIKNFVWPNEHFYLIFGEEQAGIPQKILDRCDSIVYITQYGSVRSLNVGAAASIVMYDVVRKIK